MLTVEEAAQLLRIGRTKAYAMAKQWRETGGVQGLPVLDFGDVLRVPLAKLEELTGADLGDVALTTASQTAKDASQCRQSPGPCATVDDASPTCGSRKDEAPIAARSRRKPSTDQLDLFEHPSTSA